MLIKTRLWRIPINDRYSPDLVVVGIWETTSRWVRWRWKACDISSEQSDLRAVANFGKGEEQCTWQGKLMLAVWLGMVVAMCPIFIVVGGGFWAKWVVIVAEFFVALYLGWRLWLTLYSFDERFAERGADQLSCGVDLWWVGWRSTIIKVYSSGVDYSDSCALSWMVVQCSGLWCDVADSVDKESWGRELFCALGFLWGFFFLFRSLDIQKHIKYIHKSRTRTWIKMRTNLRRRWLMVPTRWVSRYLKSCSLGPPCDKISS